MVWDKEKIKDLGLEGLIGESAERQIKLLKSLNIIDSEDDLPYELWNGLSMKIEPTLIKKPNILYHYNDDEKIDFAKKSKDISEFLEYFDLNDKEKEILCNLEKFNLINYSRLVHFSNLIIILSLFEIIKMDRTFTLICKNPYLAYHNFYQYYNKLPFHIRPGIVKRDNDHKKFVTQFTYMNILFDNGSRIRIHNHDKVSLGYNSDVLVIDGYDYVKDDEELHRSIFPIVSALRDSKLIISSSISKDPDTNFKKLFQDGLNIYKKSKLHWEDFDVDVNNFKRIMKYEDYLCEIDCVFPGTKEYRRMINLDKLSQ